MLRPCPLRLLLTVAALASAPIRASEPLARGHVFLEEDFETADSRTRWSGAGTIDRGHRSERALRLERSAETSSSALASIPLPARDMRGYLVIVRAFVRAEDVSEKPRPWNGVKCMMPIVSPAGREWPQASVETGTFGWTKVSFGFRVPADASSVSLVLGLEKVTGRVWFDDVRVTVRRPPIRRPSTAPERIASPGHGLERLRGAMIGPRVDAEDLRVLGEEWNANLVRWQLIRRGRQGSSIGLEEYETWLEGELDRLDAFLPVLERHGLVTVLDLHSPPGGRITSGGYAGSDSGLFTDRACQRKFVEIWRRIAKRYRDARPIWAFDLANEPVESGLTEELDDWCGLATRAARAIREVDPDRTLIVEASPWGGPQALAAFEPLDLPGIVYSAHMYIPHAFTHQGVHSGSPPLRYPGEIDGRRWDRQALEEALRPVVEFQETWGVPIYIGEFSAIRWAPDESAYRYLKDVIEIFEEHGWDWSYHAFREWQGWSVEHGPDGADTAPASDPTRREKLLRSWFARNEKPAWDGGPAASAERS